MSFETAAQTASSQDSSSEGSVFMGLEDFWKFKSTNRSKRSKYYRDIDIDGIRKKWGRGREPVVKDSSRRKKSDLDITIIHLDDESSQFFMPKNSTAKELLDQFYSFIGITEDQDYFGLRNSEDFWIDPEKKLRKQLIGGPKYNVKLGVKFFASDPQNITDEFARYLFTQQLHHDIAEGKLECPDDQLAAELAALLFQAWFGNFDPQEHSMSFIASHQFLPQGRQTNDFLTRVQREYARLAPRNLPPADADKLYLSKVVRLQGYGVDWHNVTGKNKVEYRLGLTPSGILAFEGKDSIGMFQWPNIENLIMDGSKLKIKTVVADTEQKRVESSTFIFQLPSKEKCRHLWKSCAEYHIFYQLTNHQQQKPQRRFFSFRSRFHSSSRTEFELFNRNSFGSSSIRKSKSTPGVSGGSFSSGGMGSPSTNRLQHKPSTGSSFRRTPSRRYSSRNVYTGRDQQQQPNTLNSFIRDGKINQSLRGMLSRVIRAP